jgi:hypothetical protein
MKYFALASIFLAAAPGAVQAQRPAATRPASSAIEAAVRLADWQLGQMQGNTVSRMTG